MYLNKIEGNVIINDLKSSCWIGNKEAKNCPTIIITSAHQTTEYIQTCNCSYDIQSKNVKHMHIEMHFMEIEENFLSSENIEIKNDSRNKESLT